MSLSRQQALDALASDDLIGLGMEADAVRRRLHPQGVVTYALEHAVPWPASAADAGDLDRRVLAGMDLGATGVRFYGTPPQQPLPWLEALLQALKQRLHGGSVTAFTPAEVAALAGRASVSLADALARLRAAGLDMLASAHHADAAGPQREDAGSPDWSTNLDVHRTAHRLGMRTVATVVFGAATAEATVDRLLALRALQDETGGLAAVLPVAFQPARHDQPEEPTAVEALKTLALSRLLLDNVEHLQTDAATQGPKVLQMTFRFGVNDAGALALTELSQRARNSNLLTEEELRRSVRDAGLEPRERDGLFAAWYLA